MRIFVDGDFEQKIPSVLLPYFKQTPHGYLLRNVGIIADFEECYVFLPHNLNPECFGSHEFKLLVRLLEKCNNLKTLGNDAQGKITFESDLFKTIRWLVHDYKQNGLYKKQQNIERVQSSGIINWPKTIRSVDPYVFNEEPVLLDFVKKSRKINNDILTLIHASALEEISTKFGMIVSDFKFSYDGHLQKIPIDKKIRILKKYRRSVNDNRTKLLIHELLNFFESEKIDDVISLVTEEFHIVWELMVSHVWNHDDQLKQYVAKSQWNAQIGSRFVTGINEQIPDTLIRDEKNHKLHILDSKYYDLRKVSSGKKRVPLEWYSIVKQYFYEFSFAFNKSGLEMGSNYFVFPELNKNYAEKDEKLLNEVGKVSIQLPEQGERIVKVAMVPVFSLIEKYLSGEIIYFD